MFPANGFKSGAVHPPLLEQELCASVALHTSNEEDILLRALSVINEKKRRLRAVKEQLADVQNDYKLFKERAAAAAGAAAAGAAAQASSLPKKRPKVNSGCSEAGSCSSQAEALKEVVGARKALAVPLPHSSSSAGVEGANAGRNAAAAAAAIAPQPAPLYSQLSQSSVSTQDLTKNFPWANLGL